MAEICPYTENCIIYRNWAEQTKDRRIDIIIHLPSNYNCLAKTALEDPTSEGGILVNKEIEKRLTNIDSPCSHITLLNLLKSIKERNG